MCVCVCACAATHSARDPLILPLFSSEDADFSIINPCQTLPTSPLSDGHKWPKLPGLLNNAESEAKVRVDVTVPTRSRFHHDGGFGGGWRGTSSQEGARALDPGGEAEFSRGKVHRGGEVEMEQLEGYTSHQEISPNH